MGRVIFNLSLEIFTCVYEALVSVHSCLKYIRPHRERDEMHLVPQWAPVFGEGHRCGPRMTASGSVLCDCQCGSGGRHRR